MLQNSNKQQARSENTLEKTVLFNLYKIAALKCISLPEESLDVWVKQITADFNNKLINNIQGGFDNLLKQKAFGGLDYAIFLEGAAENDSVRTEREWQECLQYSKTGRGQISARAAKALNSLGGMIWLKNSDPEEVTWTKKEFLAAYKNIPDPDEIDFRCPGLEQEKIYLSNQDQKLLENR